MQPIKKNRNQTIEVEVVYATPTEQELFTLMVERDATILSAIKQSNILERYPEIDLAVNRVGIFSQPKTLSDKLHEFDRIEIYRPLIADPKEARKRRAQKQIKK